MMKKVLYGVSMALLALVAIGSLQSCKDDLSDFKHEYAFDQTQLGQQIDALDTRLTTLEGEFATKIPDLEKRVKTNEGNIADLQALVATLADQATVNQIRTELDALKTDFEAYKTGNNAKIDAIETGITEINANIDKLNETVADHESRIAKLETGLNDANANITKLLTDVATQAAQIEAIQTKLGELDAALDNKADKTALNELAGKVDDLEADLNKKLTDLGTTVNDIKTALEAKDDELEDLIKVLTYRVDELYSAVKEINKKLDFITDRLDKQVTGILIQGTDNPLFGNFSLPIGVKSNMLFNWYGKSEAGKSYSFPIDDAAFSADNNAIASGVFDVLTVNNPASIPARGGYIGAVDDQISLGKVYLTINPVNVNFDKTQFSLETSAGNKLPYGLTVTPSNDELAFGYTRSVENGFYEAEVMMPAKKADIEVTDLGINQALESAMDDVLAGGSKKTAGLDILKKLYDIVSGQCKAYGVRYDWEYTDNTGNPVKTAVLSQYDLAVATAQPLGFNFLEGRGTSRKVPTFGNVDNFLNRLNDKINDKFSFKSKNITIKGKSVAFVGDDNNLTVEKNPNYNPSQIEDPNNPGSMIANPNSPYDDNKLIITIKDLQVDGKSVGTLVTKAADADNVIKAVNDKLVEAIYVALNPSDVNAAGAPKYTDEVLQGQIVAQCDVMLLEMQKEVNSAIDDITARATSTVDNAFNKVRNHSERLQQLVDLYNKVANKFNNVLANPNAYLQVAAFYKSGNGFGILSSDPASPTQMTSGSGLHLLLSTYTAELIAPAYKKYIAVTAVNGKTDGIAALNTGDILNNVLDGSQVNAVIPVDKWVSGNTYTLTYQAVDYTGRTSTKKFYIKVK